MTKRNEKNNATAVSQSKDCTSRQVFNYVVNLASKPYEQSDNEEI